MTTFAERFWAKVDKDDPNGCWLWGASRSLGYGRVGQNRKVALAHRVSFELLVGPIPAGLQLDHLCRVKHCVNPAHLEPVTPRENNLRSYSGAAMNARKTHCAHGHALDETNVYSPPKRPWTRQCRVCRDRRNLARYPSNNWKAGPKS